jgi:hypothetical protein
MSKIFLSLLTFILIFALNSAHSEIPKFKSPELLARSNVKDGHNLPSMAFISNIVPSLNSLGEVAFKVIGLDEEGAQGIWIKTNADQNGKVLYTGPSDKVITDPSINSKGEVVFSLFDDIKSDGVFLYDARKLNGKKIIDSKNYDLVYFTYPSIGDDSTLYFRGTNKNNERTLFSFNKKLDDLIIEGQELSNFTSSYLFRPSINQKGEMALKLRLGNKGEWNESNPDIIAFYTPNAKNILDKNGSIIDTVGSLTKIAEDVDSNSSSHYLSFLNQVSLSNEGHIAYSAITLDNRIGVYLYKNGVTKQMALENEGEVLNVEYFSVKVNAKGHVLFRGKDKNGKRALFFGDGQSLVKLVSEGTELQTDLGLGKILENQFFPAFSGEVELNDNDDIVFSCVLESASDSHEWGVGVYIIHPEK